MREADCAGEIAALLEGRQRFFPVTPEVAYRLGKRSYVFHSAYTYRFVDEAGRHNRLTVPAGFKCDLASVPSVARPAVPPEPLDRSAAFHDLLYRRGGRPLKGEHTILVEGKWRDAGHRWTRKEADQLFRRMLKEDSYGPGRVRRWMAYWGVRVGGHWAWR